MDNSKQETINAIEALNRSVYVMKDTENTEAVKKVSEKILELMGKL